MSAEDDIEMASTPDSHASMKRPRLEGPTPGQEESPLPKVQLLIVSMSNKIVFLFVFFQPIKTRQYFVFFKDVLFV